MDCTKAPEGGSGGRSKEKNQNIQVFVRVRPMNTQETSKHAAEVIDTPGTREVVVKERAVSNVSKTFTFDRVFGPRSKQVDVYRQVVSPLLAEVLLGYNCTVFAYGQTGTGKTFTMEGERKSNYGVENDPCAGILPRALSELFDELRQMSCEFSVRASFLELYNEELFDLLAPIEESKAKTLRLFEDANRKGSVIIQGLEEVIVNNKHEVYAVLDRGSQQRKTAATLMNATSSRSHTIFTILVHIKESSVEGEEMVKVGKLHLVDLAGSENIGKSGAVDKRAREAGSINQSLLTLGRVISALVERTPHIPYRESKLTRLLQDSLGGKTKTSIIATISPAATNIEETLSTLDYAHRAKNIMNRPEVNQKISKKEAITMYTDEIERLRKDLNAARGKDGFFMDHENYNSLIGQIQSQTYELNEKSNKIKEMEETFTTKEEELREAGEVIADLQFDLKSKQVIMDNLKSQKAKLESRLAFYGRKNDELKFLLKYHEDTEEKMSTEANQLLNTTTDTLNMVDRLHERLDRKQYVEQTNWRNAERFREDFATAVNEIIENVGEIKQTHTIGISNLRELLNKRNAERKEHMEVYSAMFHSTTATMESLQATLAEICSRFHSIAQSRFEALGNSVTRETENEKTKMVSSLKSFGACFGSLSKQFVDMKGELKSLEKEIEVKFNSMNQVVSEILKSNVSRFNQTEKALVDLRNNWGTAVQSIYATSSAVQADQEKFKAEYNKKISSLCDSLNELKAGTESHLEDTAAAFSVINKKLETSTNEITSKITKESENIHGTRVPTEKAIKNVDQFRLENVTNHQAVLGRMHDRMETEANNAKKMQTRMTETTNTFVGDMNHLAVLVTESCGNATQSLEEVDKSMFDVNQHQLSAIKALKSESFIGVKEITDGEDKCIEKLVDHVDRQCDCISTGCTEVGSSLAQMSGTVREFWEETYLTDGHTGGTPMRRKFDFPTVLSKPSPSTRVIARYRQTRNDVQDAIDECADESDLNSSASTLLDEKHSQESNNDPGEYNLEDETENADPEKKPASIASSSSSSEKNDLAKDVTKPEQNGKTAKKNQSKEKKKDSDSETPALASKVKPTSNENLAKKNQPKEAEKKKDSDSEVRQPPAPKKSDEQDNKPGSGTGKPQMEVKKIGKQSKKQKRKSGGGHTGVLKPPN